MSRQRYDIWMDFVVFVGQYVLVCDEWKPLPSPCTPPASSARQASQRVIYIINAKGECVKIKYIDFEEHAVSRMELPSPVGEG